MKRIICLIILTCMTLALICACNQNGNKEDTTTTVAQEDDTTTEPITRRRERSTEETTTEKPGGGTTEPVTEKPRDPFDFGTVDDNPDLDRYSDFY